MHFKVLVIGDDVESQLAPYQEDSRDFCEFEPCDMDLMKQEYDKEVARRAVQNTENYLSIDMYLDEQGYEKVEDVWGRHINLNAEWDWYEIGGRWCGSLKMIDPLKEDRVINFHYSMTDEEKKSLFGYCDSDLKKNIDLKGMIEERSKLAEKEYKKFYRKISKKDIKGFMPWSSFYDRVTIDKEFGVEVANYLYDLQPLSKKLRIVGVNEKGDSLWSHGAVENFVTKSLKEYVYHKVPTAITCQAIVIDGDWFSRDSFENDKDWNEFIEKSLDQCQDDDLLTIVDCHI